MNRNIRRIWGLLAGLAWACPGFGHAQTMPPIPPILPTDSTTLKQYTSTVTVSLYQRDDLLPAAVTTSSPSRCTTTGTSLYKDVTDCWLPEWDPVNGGKEVYVVINSPSAGPPTLVSPVSATFPLVLDAPNPFVAALTTSAYPGQCTNIGSGTEADFTLSEISTQLTDTTGTLHQGYKLTPTDCGGMAVIKVDIQAGTLKFILPRDGTANVPANGIPDVWENLYSGNLTPVADIDTGPLGKSPLYDGISSFDEYRGFIVSGKQVRTDPQHKDLFVHLVKAQCIPDGVTFTGTNKTSYFGGGATTYPTPSKPNATLTLPAAAAAPYADGTVTFTSSAAVFSNANVSYEISETNVPSDKYAGRARIVAVANSTTVTAQLLQQFNNSTLSSGNWQLSEPLFPITSTMLSPDQVHLLGYGLGQMNTRTNEWVDGFSGMKTPFSPNVTDSVSDRTVNPNRIYGEAQKGVRVIECLDTSSPSVLGWTIGVDSPNVAGNSIVYTQRIVDYYTNTLIGTSTTLRYSTASASLVNGTWTWKWSSPTPVAATFILSKAFQFYADHEVGHSLDLTPTVQGTNKVTYGYHWAPGTGDCLDQAITSTAKSGVVTFYIPSFCGNADQGSFLIK